MDGNRDEPLAEIAIPEAYQARIKEARHNMIERLAESDDQMLSRYLDGIEFSNDEISELLAVNGERIKQERKRKTLRGEVVLNNHVV